MAAYLWNRTESMTLPPGKMPFEMVNSHKPDLSHIWVFGSRCWAHIPSKLQTKLSPHVCQAIFMGYPEGIKGYHVWDKTSQVFFIARDVEFNENISGLHLTSDTDSEEDEEEASPVSNHISNPSTPSTTPTEDAPTINVPHCSTQICKLTEKGVAWEAEMAATRLHLQQLQEHCAEASKPQEP